MNLRSIILWFLLLFALLPLLAAAFINFPFVFDRLELFYHKAHLQNLRADFRGLDQHLARRQQMVETLSKIPAPGLNLNPMGQLQQQDLDRQRLKYLGHLNRLLSDMPDVVQVLFIDSKGFPAFWVDRLTTAATQLRLMPSAADPILPPPDLLNAVLYGQWNRVVVGRLIILKPNKDFTGTALHIIGPVLASNSNKAIGATVMTIDIGGMANLHKDSHWVKQDGSYLSASPLKTSNAFDDFPGLQKIFQDRKLALWEHKGKQAIWMPMFATDNFELLWVGREVDSLPVASLIQQLTSQVLAIIFIIILFTLMAASWVAKKTSKISEDITKGIQSIIEEHKLVQFDWNKPKELKILGQRLNEMSQLHNDNLSQLREHTQALEASNQYKSEFLANVSHELRTPLNSIHLLSKLLASSQENIPAETKQQAKVIHQASVNLKSLIDNILDMSRIEAGKNAVNIETILLTEHLNHTLQLLKPQFEQKGLTLELEFETGAPTRIHSDPDKIGQIVRNFLSNALKFTTKGGAVICVHGNRQEKRFPVCISVRDTGIGIPSNKQKQIFAAFQQADGATNRRYGGSGLGLTISRQLARLLGGEILVESEAGQGSTFILGLPDTASVGQENNLAISHEPDSDFPDSSLSNPIQADFEGKGILLIDQDVDSLLRLTPILKDWGMDICAAADAEEASETLMDDNEGRCELILINCCSKGQNLSAMLDLLSDSSERQPGLIVMANPETVVVDEHQQIDKLIRDANDTQQLHDAIASLIENPNQ